MSIGRPRGVSSVGASAKYLLGMDDKGRTVAIEGSAELGALTSTNVDYLEELISGSANPTDHLVSPLQRETITAALSTTQAQQATATGTYYKARVVWNNNGASASALLRIAVNADNAVHGLMIGQSAKRRDYEMTMGEGVMLVCGIPIASLTFSADSSITANTHQLQVTFGN